MGWTQVKFWQYGLDKSKQRLRIGEGRLAQESDCEGESVLEKKDERKKDILRNGGKEGIGGGL